MARSYEDKEPNWGQALDRPVLLDRGGDVDTTAEVRNSAGVREVWAQPTKICRCQSGHVDCLGVLGRHDRGMEQRNWTVGDVDFERGPIRVRVASVAAFFNTIDPSPLEQRSLNVEVADWIEEWAEDLPVRAPVVIEVFIDAGSDEDQRAAVRSAVHSHFEYRAWQTARSLHKLLRDGRFSLAFGVAALVVFNTAARLIDKNHAVWGIAHEGLLVIGWVAMWRPLEIFLYQWWPMRRERRACQRLSDASIVFTESAPARPIRRGRPAL
jgi:hypothetical protein